MSTSMPQTGSRAILGSLMLACSAFGSSAFCTGCSCLLNWLSITIPHLFSGRQRPSRRHCTSVPKLPPTRPPPNPPALLRCASAHCIPSLPCREFTSRMATFALTVAFRLPREEADYSEQGSLAQRGVRGRERCQPIQPKKSRKHLRQLSWPQRALRQACEGNRALYRD